MANAADHTRPQHGLQAQKNGLSRKISQSSDFPHRIARVTLDAVFADREDAGVDRIRGLNGMGVGHAEGSNLSVRIQLGDEVGVAIEVLCGDAIAGIYDSL